MRRILVGIGITGLLLAAGWTQAQTSTGRDSSGSSGSMGSSGSSGSATSPSDTGTSGSTMGSSGSTAGGSASAMGATQELSGRVQSFDRSNNTLTVADKPLKVDSSTEVMKDGAKASINDIKEGDQVRASYSGSGDNLHVQRLDITSSAGKSGSTGSMGGPSGTTPPSGAPSTGGSSGSKGY